MERTLPPKKKREVETPESKINIETFVSPHGGYLPFPPEYCISPRILVDSDKIPYTDLIICATHCKDAKCKRYKEYRKLLDQSHPTVHKIIRG